jgi:ribonuclease BN (tRNA processing enzyme)
VDVTLLGSGGFVPTDRRETACALVREGAEALLIDSGSGARRLVVDRRLLDGVERVHAVYSHFHLDHIGGVFALPALDVPVELWLPARMLEGLDGRELVRRLVGPPFAPASFLSSYASINELDGGPVRIGPFALDTRIQTRHSNPTLAFRFGDELVWCTDTGYDEGNAEFARGARVLCHEAFHASDTTDDPGHTAAGDAARIAAAAGVERLVLIHVNPEHDDEDALLAHARPIFPATEVARDGLVL